MRNRTVQNERRLFLYTCLLAGILISAGLAGCGSNGPATQPEQQAQTPKRYQLAGRVVSVDPAKQRVVVDAGEIPGFMSAMTMGYAVKNKDLLTPLAPEDQITADVVVNGSDVYLENVVVVKKADQSKSASPQPGKQ